MVQSRHKAPSINSSSLFSAVHEMNGYGAVLPLVQNYYPVEEDAGIFCWGFKYTTGVFEFFYHQTREKATLQRDKFISALNAWHVSGREQRT